jgi:hypothetical protein
MAQAGGQDTEPPSRLLVVPWGLTQTRQGPMLVDGETLRILPERQRLARADRVPIDYDHEAAFGKNKGKPRHIAGYGTPTAVEGEGIYLTDIRWTPEGRLYWANYEDISPAILQQKTSGRVTFLDSVALTPRGEIEGLSLFSADSADTYPSSNPTKATPPKRMNTDKLKKYLKRRGVSFSEDATPDELMTLAEAAMEQEVQDEEGAGMAADSVTAKLKKMEDELQALKSADLNRQKASEDARKKEIIAAASAKGKLLPSDEIIAQMSADLLQKLADEAPENTVKTNPADGLNPAHKTGTGEKKITLSAEAREVARQAGISEEQAMKFMALDDAPILNLKKGEE